MRLNNVYIDVRNHLLQQIVTGKINDGDTLPSVRALAQELKVNPNTVQKAYAFLEERDMTEIKVGAGRSLVMDDDKLAILKEELVNELVDYVNNTSSNMGIDVKDVKEKL